MLNRPVDRYILWMTQQIGAGFLVITFAFQPVVPGFHRHNSCACVPWYVNLRNYFNMQGVGVLENIDILFTGIKATARELIYIRA